MIDRAIVPSDTAAVVGSAVAVVKAHSDAHGVRMECMLSGGLLEDASAEEERGLLEVERRQEGWVTLVCLVAKGMGAS